MIRPLLPTDLIAILLQDGSLSNRARPKDNVGREEARFLTLATLLGQWINSRGRRCTMVWAKGIRLRGLASARNLSSPHAWEVDQLLLNEQDEECCLSLLEKLNVAGVELGVEKVFLRLPAESSLVDIAKEAGFTPYITEFLYGRKREEGKSVDYGATFPGSHRSKQVDDDYRLFELYEDCFPTPIRRVEGMTFKEWQATKDKWAGKDWIFEEGGSLIGWLRVKTARDRGQFEVLAVREGKLEQIVEYSLKALEGCRYLFCLIPEFQGELTRLLQDHGFNEIKRYSASIKELTARAHEPHLVPLGV